MWWGALDGLHWWDPLIPLLSADERKRAARMRIVAARVRSLAAWALTRVPLAAGDAGPTNALAFTISRHGKPRLATG